MPKVEEIKIEHGLEKQLYFAHRARLSHDKIGLAREALEDVGEDSSEYTELQLQTLVNEGFLEGYPLFGKHV